MHGLCQFAEKYCLSFDWLLRRPQRAAQWLATSWGPSPALTPARLQEFKTALEKLDDRSMRAVTFYRQ
jgi:hypothetical protein